MGHQGIMAVQVAITITAKSFIESMIPQRSVHDIYSHTVGKLNGRCPIIFFHRLFGVLVFATKQPVRCLRSRTHKDIFHVGSHARKHLHAVGVFFINIGVRVYEVTCAKQVHLLEEIDFIRIVETSIDDRYVHTLAREACPMKTITAMDIDLTESLAVMMSGFLHLIGHFLLPFLVARRDAVGLCPHLFHPCHERHLLHLVHQSCIRHFQHHGIVPLAGRDQSSTHIRQLLYIDTAHRQVGFIHRQLLAVSPFYRPFTQESLRVIHCVGRTYLVFQAYPIFIHLLGRCRQAQCNHQAS